MDRQKFIKSTFSLILVGFITKILSSLAKIIMARKIGIEAMGIYMLVVPIYIFFINVVQLSLPTTIATKIASNPNKTSKVVITASVISLIINILFMIGIVTFAPVIANKFLHNKETYLSIISLALLVPLISLGGLIKGYYMGIGKIEVTAYSQISEEIARIIFVILFSLMFVSKGNEYLAYAAFLSLCAGEVFSLVHMILFIPNIKNKPKLLFKGMTKKENYITKDILDVSLPLTGGKLISVIAYTFEPIILSSIMIHLGFNSTYITNEYGIISGYAFPLLLLPGFFASAFARVILHPMSSMVGKGNKEGAKKLFYSILMISLSIGIFFSIVFFFFSKELMFLLYKNSNGANYVRMFSFPFILYYIEAPLISAMTAISKTKKIMLYDTISSIARILLMVILIPKIQVHAVGVATVISSSLLVLMMLIDVFFFLRKND